MLNTHAQFLKDADGNVYDAWKGINEVIIQYGKAEISKNFFKILEGCAREGWKHWGYFNYQEPGSSCLYKVYRLRGKYFIELQSAKMHCKARELVTSSSSQIKVTTSVSSALLKDKRLQLNQRLDEIFVRMGAQATIQHFLSTVSLIFKLVEENESEFDGIPMLYELNTPSQ